MTQCPDHAVYSFQVHLALSRHTIQKHRHITDIILDICTQQTHLPSHHWLQTAHRNTHNVVTPISYYA